MDNFRDFCKKTTEQALEEDKYDAANIEENKGREGKPYLLNGKEWKGGYCVRSC